MSTCHAPYDCRRERDWSLCHRRLYCCVLWQMMAEAAPYPCDCRGDLAFYSRSHLFSITSRGCTPCENRVESRYSSLALFVAHLAVCLPIGNADFGWAIARWSCGRDQVRADKEAMMATGTVKWLPDEGLWIHCAAGRRQRCIRPYLSGRARRPELSQRGSNGRISSGQQPR